MANANGKSRYWPFNAYTTSSIEPIEYPDFISTSDNGFEDSADYFPSVENPPPSSEQSGPIPPHRPILKIPEKQQIAPADVNKPITIANRGRDRKSRQVSQTEIDPEYAVTSLGGMVRSRRPSISFNPLVTLDDGNEVPLGDSSPKDTHVQTKSKNYGPHIQSDGPHFRRVNSESDTSNYDRFTGKLMVLKDRANRADKRRVIPRHGGKGLSPNPLSQSSLESQAVIDSDLPSLSSLRSDSPASSQVRTPDGSSGNFSEPGISSTPPLKSLDQTLMDFTLSPVDISNQYYQPPAYSKSTSSCPNPKNEPITQPTDRSFANSFEPTPATCRTQSGLSTSSTSHSPATAFLSKWSQQSSLVAPAPDAEGQEVGAYVLGKTIGTGGFSVVKEAFTIENYMRVQRAVKIVRKRISSKSNRENDNFQEAFEREIALWRCLAHPHILPLIAVYETPYATFCFTRLVEGGTLFDLVKHSRGALPLRKVKYFARQLANALRYLHEDMRVVHRDVKLENCLLDISQVAPEGSLLLCDFGAAQFLTGEAEADGAHAATAGSLEYAAPELLDGQAHGVSAALDVWAFGVLLYALLTGDLPFRHTFQPRVAMLILRGEWDQSAVGRSGEEARELLSGCLNKEVEARWSVGEVLESRFLREHGEGSWLD
ncbi:MAG: hypothetical protein M1829_004160 [Trizodia sp. TS-e1964]|nr:MAG: hypothetical protein M1829_004160 [Trizodia sp. TS-e1964]